MGSIEDGFAGMELHGELVSNLLFRDTATETPLVTIFDRSRAVLECSGLGAPGHFDTASKCSISHAARILEEDSGLSLTQDFELYLMGKPYHNHENGCWTTVYPFSWILKESATSLHRQAQWKWCLPQRFLDGQCDGHMIGQSSKSIWRTWLRNGGLFSNPGDSRISERGARVFHEALLSMRNDYESGAGYMATTALQHLHDVLAEITTDDSKALLWCRTRMIAWHLIYNGRPSMNAAISKSLLSCLWRLWFIQDNRMKMLEVIKTCIQERKTFSSRIGESFVSYLRKSFSQQLESSDVLHLKILTLSSSIIKSAVLTALKQCNISFDIRILESRPLCEGASMASVIVKQAGDSESDRLKITIATDASVALMAKDVDLVLLGADRITASGDVSNKTGSYPAVLCAQALGHISPVTPKVVVLSGIEKVVKPGPMSEYEEEDNGPLQIWRIWELAGCRKEARLLTSDRRVEFKNVAFEWIPAECVDVYLNEDGEMTRQQIKEQSLSMEKLDTDVFGDL